MPILSRLYAAVTSDDDDSDGESSDSSAPETDDDGNDDAESGQFFDGESDSDNSTEESDSDGDIFGPEDAGSGGESAGDDGIVDDGSESPGADDAPVDPYSDLEAESPEEQVEELKEMLDDVRDEKAELEVTVNTLESENENLSETIESLREKRADLEEENAKLQSALRKERKEMENFKDRAKKREQQARDAAIGDIVEDMTEVRDTLQRALDQDKDMEIREGVEATLRSFDKIMSEYDIEVIEPEPGTEPDAQRHEIMMKSEDENIPEGEISEAFSAGYERDGHVFKPAQVVVSSGQPDEPIPAPPPDEEQQTDDLDADADEPIPAQPPDDTTEDDERPDETADGGDGETESEFEFDT